MWLHDAVKFAKYLILCSLQVQFAVKPPEKFVVFSHSLLRELQYLSLFKICVKWPHGVTDTKWTFECFVKATTQTDTPYKAQAVRCRYDMSENSSALFTWVHLLTVWSGGPGLWFRHIFVGFRTGLTTYPIYLSCQANFRSYVSARGGASQKIPCGIMGMHHPQSCTELCFQENLGTGEGTALTTARIQGFQTI